MTEKKASRRWFVVTNNSIGIETFFSGILCSRISCIDSSSIINRYTKSKRGIFLSMFNLSNNFFLHGWLLASVG